MADLDQRPLHIRFGEAVAAHLRAEGMDRWVVNLTASLTAITVEITYDDGQPTPVTYPSVVLTFLPHILASMVDWAAPVAYIASHLRPTYLETAEAAIERATLNGDSAAVMQWDRVISEVRAAQPPQWQTDFTEAMAAVERERRRRG